MSRTLVMTDIHGKKEKAEEMLRELKYNLNDKLILLGDYVDRGEDSRGVIDLIINLSEKGDLVCLLGNHDEWFRKYLSKSLDFESILHWLYHGGLATLNSYILETNNSNFVAGLNSLQLFSKWYCDYRDTESMIMYETLNNKNYFVGYENDINNKMFILLGYKFGNVSVINSIDVLNEIREHIISNYKSHVDFLNSLELYYEDENYFYAHGGCNIFKEDLSENIKDEIIWPNRNLFFSSELNLSKTIIVGHTVVTYIPNHSKLEVYISDCGDKIGLDGGLVFGLKMFSLIIEDSTGNFEIIEVNGDAQ